MTRRPAQAFKCARGFSFASGLSTSVRFAYIDGFAVKVRSAANRSARTVYEDVGHVSACPLAWDPEGRFLFHAHDQILRIDTRSAKARPITRFRGADRSGVHWQLQGSPEGRTLIFRGDRNHRAAGKIAPRARISAVPATGGPEKELFRPSRASKDHLWQFEVNWRRGLIIANSCGPGGWRLWRMDLEGKNARVIQKADDLSDFAVSPDGTRIAIECEDGIWLIDVDRRSKHKLVERGDNAAWSPDCARIAFMDGDAALGVVDTHTGERSRLVWSEEPKSSPYPVGGWAMNPVWSPDGRMLWFTVTKSVRHEKVRDPRFVARMRERFGAGSRDHRIAEENSHWSFDHRVGIVDFRERRVWMAAGYWRSVSWAP